MKPIETLVKSHFSGASVGSIEELPGGLINLTFRVKLDDGSTVIAQKVNTDVFNDLESVHRNIEVVARHLEDNGYMFDFPAPQISTSNSSYMEIEGQTWRILPNIEGSYAVEKPSSVEMARNAGQCLGHFHACTADLDSSKLIVTIPNFHTGRLRIDQFEGAVWETDLTGIRLVGEIIKHFHVLQDWDEICSQIPQHVVHFDTKIENFLFKNGTEDVAALIDLDTIMPGSRLSDVGDMIRSFCDDGTEVPNLDFRDAVIEGYLSEMDKHVTDDEKSFLKFSGSALTLMQSLRFLTDHLLGDIYYQTEFEGQNLERAERQFALYQRLNS